MFFLCFAFAVIMYKEKRQFTLKTSFMKEYTLSSPKNKIYSYRNIIASFYKKNLYLNKEKKLGIGNWYYVHFYNNDYSYIQKLIKIERQNQINKDTFVLFLTDDILDKISNFSLIKKIEPSDKYIEDRISFEKSNHLIVTVLKDSQLIENEKYYTIVKQNTIDSFIVRIDSVNEEEFINKKMKSIKILSEIPEVKTITDYQLPVSHNAIISGFTQKNRFDFEYMAPLGYPYLHRYLNDYGINGENQTITIFDTPIDIYHSMFRDEKVPIELNKYMPNHRKLIYYNFNGSLDDLQQTIKINDHGTHVAGTAAGKSICPNNPLNVNNFDGIAPEAKMIYGGHFNKVDVIKEMKNLMKKYNSKITTNSWGYKFYNPIENFDYGLLAYEQSDITFIFSAGNEYTARGNFTIGDPGGSKNIITVGALNNFYAQNPLPAYIFRYTDPNNIVSLRKAVHEMDPWIIGSIGTEPYKSKILAVNFSNGNQCNLVENDNFSIFYGPYNEWSDTCNYSSNSQVFISLDDKKFMELLSGSGNALISTIFSCNKENHQLSRASFSSTGPAHLGILKPDVMAPGERIISAKALPNNTTPHGCLDQFYGDLIFMSGTSMATPNVAGAMALIHQYFDSEKWLENVKIDGSTSRALLINSCKHPLGSKSPDITFGHGVVDLSTILPIENDFGLQITHQTPDINNENTHSVAEKGHVVSKIIINETMKKTKLQITLSYLDPMLNYESLIPITRDLDLVVTSPTKKIFIGDHIKTNDTQHASANEKVIIDEDEVENGEYTIHIFGGNFIDSFLSDSPQKQEFSVAASGPIDNGYLEFKDSDECLCEKCDSDNPGLCSCDDSKSIGPICQVDIQTSNESGIEVNVGPLEVKRIRIVSDKKIKSIAATSDYPGQYATIWISKKCHLALGEYDVMGETGNQTLNEKKKTKVKFDSKEICVAIFNNNDRFATYNIEIIKETNKNLALIIGVVVGGVALIAIIIIVVICCIKRGCCKKSADKEDKSISENDQE